MGKFIETINSNPTHPTGLNKDLNFEELAINTDEALQQLQQKWWPILHANVDIQDPQGVFRIGLLKLAYSYSRFIALSYGFQHAFGEDANNNQNEKAFLMRCLSAATDVITAVVDYNNRENHGSMFDTVQMNKLCLSYSRPPSLSRFSSLNLPLISTMLPALTPFNASKAQSTTLAALRLAWTRGMLRKCMPST
ncbi:hypothetical protein PM082_016157 [Marasmius tenuissimus]|nr:hypothetical protein PM082_016157 [Marasmius tenuissimus]